MFWRTDATLFVYVSRRSDRTSLRRYALDYPSYMHDPLLYRNKYRIPSARLAGWDYGNPGSYFVTICTHGRIPWFGECRNGYVCLSDIGAIAAHCWHTIPLHFPHVTLGAWIVMPDHVHGILTINVCETFGSNVSTTAATATPLHRPASGSVGSIIGQFKSVCAKRARSVGHTDFRWQPRYHDRIIRDPADYLGIARYIRLNPMNHR